LSLAALVMPACSEKPAQTPVTTLEMGSSSTYAAPIGATVPAIVELEDMYRAPETYDVRITVMEILRGETSADLMNKASAFNAPAKNGFEYVAAHIRFEYSARGAPGDKTWELRGNQFDAFSGEGKLYENPSIVPPEPGLSGTLSSGDSKQGWIVFTVAKNDRKPVMIFNPGSVWFQLY
jgi:hypothetical protein